MPIAISRGLLPLLAAVVAVAPGTGAAAAERPRITVLGVRGEGGAALAPELSRRLCEVNACVPPHRVRRAGKLDFAVARENGVSGVVFGKVVRSARGRRLELVLLAGSYAPVRTWALPIGPDGTLAPRALDRAAREVAAALGPRAPEPRAPSASAATTPAPAPPADGPAATAAAAPPPAPGRRPADGAAPERPPVVAVELGVLVTTRDLSYSGTGTSGPTLMKFSAGAIAAPALRVELTPLAGADGWYAGATVFGAYARSVGLQTEDATPARTRRDTTLSALDLGAGLRLRPMPSSRATLLAWAAYRASSVKVSPGGAIPGLPDTDLAGPAAGLELEAPLAPRVALLVGAGYTRWLRARALVGGYFPDGSAWALDASVGLSLALTRRFSLRLTGAWERTSFTLSGASAYQATGATESYLGGRAGIRGAF